MQINNLFIYKKSKILDFMKFNRSDTCAWRQFFAFKRYGVKYLIILDWSIFKNHVYRTYIQTKLAQVVSYATLNCFFNIDKQVVNFNVLFNGRESTK